MARYFETPLGLVWIDRPPTMHFEVDHLTPAWRFITTFGLEVAAFEVTQPTDEQIAAAVNEQDMLARFSARMDALGRHGDPWYLLKNEVDAWEQSILARTRTAPAETPP